MTFSAWYSVWTFPTLMAPLLMLVISTPALRPFPCPLDNIFAAAAAAPAAVAASGLSSALSIGMDDFLSPSASGAAAELLLRDADGDGLASQAGALSGSGDTAKARSLLPLVHGERIQFLRTAAATWGGGVVQNRTPDTPDAEATPAAAQWYAVPHSPLPAAPASPSNHAALPTVAAIPADPVAPAAAVESPDPNAMQPSSPIRQPETGSPAEAVDPSQTKGRAPSAVAGEAAARATAGAAPAAAPAGESSPTPYGRAPSSAVGLAAARASVAAATAQAADRPSAQDDDTAYFPPTRNGQMRAPGVIPSSAPSPVYSMPMRYQPAHSSSVGNVPAGPNSSAMYAVGPTNLGPPAAPSYSASNLYPGLAQAQLQSAPWLAVNTPASVAPANTALPQPAAPQRLAGGRFRNIGLVPAAVAGGRLGRVGLQA
eukprot:GHVT01102435.1.p1 GENE.GHVT01102435.1~~GHVT01102435.1.p1  ORF type:complete len:429 (+),score=87.63 GHVT01102435.1:926-2212(+)